MNRVGMTVVVMMATLATLGGGCATDPNGQGGGVNLSSAQKDALIGAALGGVVGAVAGNNMGHTSGHRDKGALIGAAVGGLVGHEVGGQQDAINQQQNQIQQLQLQAQVTTIWLVNSNGSKSAVTLTKAQGGQWIGPRGEYYDGLPSAEQLKKIYGF